MSDQPTNEYCEIELNFTQEENDRLVDLYCQSRLDHCSFSMYNDLKETRDIKDALYHAVLNQIINDALRQEIQRMDAEQTLVDQNEDVGC